MTQPSLTRYNALGQKYKQTKFHKYRSLLYHPLVHLSKNLLHKVGCFEIDINQDPGKNDAFSGLSPQCHLPTRLNECLQEFGQNFPLDVRKSITVSLVKQLLNLKQLKVEIKWEHSRYTTNNNLHSELGFQVSDVFCCQLCWWVVHINRPIIKWITTDNRSISIRRKQINI